MSADRVSLPTPTSPGPTPGAAGFSAATYTICTYNRTTIFYTLACAVYSMVALARPYNLCMQGPRVCKPSVANSRSDFPLQTRGPYIQIVYKMVNLHNIV
eukprot:COSAG02_NODE_856_length_16468_cov_131.787831_19_plen_100_part_00